MPTRNPNEAAVEYAFKRWVADNALGLQAVSTEVRNSILRMKLQELAQTHGLK